MRAPVKRWIPRLVVPAALGGLAWLILAGMGGPGREGPGRRGTSDPVPVEVVPVARGRIELRRTFSGTLEAPARIVVAPKIGGRVERLSVDMADPIERGQVVALLDSDEYEQAVMQARAELAVARAMHVEATSIPQGPDWSLHRVLRDHLVRCEPDREAVDEVPEDAL